MSRASCFKDDYLRALTRLSEAALVANDLEGCIGYSNKILGKDAAREAAYQNLMFCHARLGHPARALRWFELCREALERELDRAPGVSADVRPHRSASKRRTLRVDVTIS
jgi:DNA-binding SARP family transcriptional activator